MVSHGVGCGGSHQALCLSAALSCRWESWGQQLEWAGRPAGTRLSSCLCSIRPSGSAARPQSICLFTGPSDTHDPEGNEATSSTRTLWAALLQALQHMEEVALLPGRQLSALQSIQHLLLPIAQLRSSGTSLPFAVPLLSPPFWALSLSFVWFLSPLHTALWILPVTKVCLLNGT